jgi:hypothetical protein
VKETAVDDRVETAAEIAKLKRVTDAEVDRQSALLGLTLRPRDRRRHEIDTDDIVTA